MRYARFQALAMVLGTIAVVATLAVNPVAQPQPAEIAAQLLIVVVLGAAVYAGRHGGFIGALVATFVYVIMRLPLLSQMGLSADIAVMLAVRITTFAVVGVIGGEISSRIKYVFVRMEDSSFIDHDTGVYNARYAGTAIGGGVALYRRYGVPYSVALITCVPATFQDSSPRRTASRLHAIASHVRNDIRVVDDLAHLGDGRFAVLLPHTDHDGGTVCASRLVTGLLDKLSSAPGSVTARVLTANEDDAELCVLANRLAPHASGDVCDPGAGQRPPAPQERRAPAQS